MLGTILWVAVIIGFFAWAGYVLHKRNTTGPDMGPEVRGDRERKAGFYGGGGA